MDFCFFSCIVTQFIMMWFEKMLFSLYYLDDLFQTNVIALDCFFKKETATRNLQWLLPRGAWHERQRHGQ